MFSSFPRGAAVFWTPTVGDLKDIERTLPAYFKSQKLTPSVRTPGFHEYYRQCAGFLRCQQRLVYINAFAPRIKEEMEESARIRKQSFNWKRNPVVVCDGGRSFYGIEYDPATGKFSNLYFNGR